jgi:hypothetical protein
VRRRSPRGQRGGRRLRRMRWKGRWSGRCGRIELGARRVRVQRRAREFGTHVRQRGQRRRRRSGPAWWSRCVRGNGRIGDRRCEHRIRRPAGLCGWKGWQRWSWRRRRRRPWWALHCDRVRRSRAFADRWDASRTQVWQRRCGRSRRQRKNDRFKRRNGWSKRDAAAPLDALQKRHDAVEDHRAPEAASEAAEAELADDEGRVEYEISGRDDSVHKILPRCVSRAMRENHRAKVGRKQGSRTPVTSSAPFRASVPPSYLRCTSRMHFAGQHSRRRVVRELGP